jgi:hypothetical protein
MSVASPVDDLRRLGTSERRSLIGVVQGSDGRSGKRRSAGHLIAPGSSGRSPRTRTTDAVAKVLLVARGRRIKARDAASIGWADGSDGNPRTGDQRRVLPLCCALDDRNGKLTSGVLHRSKPATRRELTDMGHTTEVSCMFSMTVQSRGGRGA